jgi:hypothetical protein
VEREPQLLFSSLRSWAVKKAREVFLLPGELVDANWEVIGKGRGRLTVCHDRDYLTGVVRFSGMRMLGSRR